MSKRSDKDGHGFVTAYELIERARRRRERILAGQVKWGRWSYDPSDRTIEIAAESYWIAIERLDNSVAVLDFIAQVSGKSWATKADVGALVKCLDDLLGLQATMCGGGINGKAGKKIAPHIMRRLLTPAEPSTKGRRV